MTLEYVNYILWPLEQSGNIHLHFTHSGPNLEIRVELYSWHYGQKILFIPRIFAEHNVHPNIIP